MIFLSGLLLFFLLTFKNLTCKNSTNNFLRMLLTTVPSFEFVKFIQILCLIILPVSLVAIILTVIFHYRKKRNGMKITENLDKKVAHLLTQGIVFEELPNDKPWLWREAHLKDPCNNHLILYFAGENRVNPPWKLK